MSQLQKNLKHPKRFYQDVGLVADPNKIKKSKKKKVERTSEFVRELEKVANRPTKKNFKFGRVMCEELEYYINKYGNNYEAMARDRRNIYQDSPGQLKKKIVKYTRIHKDSTNH